MVFPGTEFLVNNFPVSLLQIRHPLPLASIISPEESVVNFTENPFYVRSCFSLAAFRILTFPGLLAAWLWCASEDTTFLSELRTVLHMNLSFQKVNIFLVVTWMPLILWCRWLFPSIHIHKCVCLRAFAPTLCPKISGKSENVEPMKICPKVPTNIAVWPQSPQEDI